MIAWTGLMAEYKDDDIKATIERGAHTSGLEVFRLWWTDYVVNEWQEDFPTYHLALKRLAHLLIALTTESKSFDEGYLAFIGAELGYDDTFAWRCRDYIRALTERGYPCRVEDVGGGILVVEATSIDGRTITWADTSDLSARVGFYAAHLMASGEQCAMLEWPEETELTERHGTQVADLLDHLWVVAQEIVAPHTHDFPTDIENPWCRICGARKADAAVV